MHVHKVLLHFELAYHIYKKVLGNILCIPHLKGSGLSNKMMPVSEFVCQPAPFSFKATETFYSAR